MTSRGLGHKVALEEVLVILRSLRMVWRRQGFWFGKYLWRTCLGDDPGEFTV